MRILARLCGLGGVVAQTGPQTEATATTQGSLTHIGGARAARRGRI